MTGSVAVALGYGEALDGGVSVGVPAHMLTVECSAVQSVKPIPAPTGARPPDGASAKAPLLPLSILKIPPAAKEVQGVSKASSWSLLYFLCWPEVWSSWFTRRPRGTESTKLS